MSQVILLFPPLVALNFGRYYPSTAVLSGFLRVHGLETNQFDLNEEFADYLATDEVLQLLGREDILGRPADSIVAGAVRWVGENRPRLFDAQGRHLFGDPDHDLNVLELLAIPFTIDPTSELLGSITRTSPALAVYWDFFQRSGIADRIAADTVLVGISAPMGPQLVPALILAKLLKARRPSLRVVLGGATLSLMPSSDLNTLLAGNEEVDCVVQADGEFPLLELCRQAISGYWDPAPIPGVSSLVSGAFSLNHPSAGPSVNDLPPADYAADILARLSEPVLGITQARGCYWGQCDYCDHVNVHEGSGAFRSRRPESFVDEIDHQVASTGVDRFRVITESIPPAFARRTSELLLERGLKIRWNSFAMVDRHFDRELLALMVEAGCEYLVVGIESMNTRVLKLVHKASDREGNLRFLRDARDVGMKVRVNLIPDLPTTSLDEALQSLADVRSMADCYESVSIFPFEPTRSSNIGRYPEQFGFELATGNRTQGPAQFEMNRLNVIDPAMSEAERAHVQAEFASFADEFARRKLGVVLAPTDADRPLRVPVEYVDVLGIGERVVYTQVSTRKAISIPRRTALLLEAYLAGQQFTSSDVAARIGEGNAGALLQALERVGMIVAVDPQN